MIEVQITMKDIPHSEAIENQIRFKAQKLALYSDRITSCKVVVDVPQKHKHQGKIFGVHVDVNVPGKELVATRKQNEDIYIAIRDAFTAVTRQLEKYVQKRNGFVKQHEDYTTLDLGDSSV